MLSQVTGLSEASCEYAFAASQYLNTQRRWHHVSTSLSPRKKTLFRPGTLEAKMLDMAYRADRYDAWKRSNLAAVKRYQARQREQAQQAKDRKE